MTYPHAQLGEVGSLIAGSGFPNKYQGLSRGDYPFAKVGDISARARAGYRYMSSANNWVSYQIAKDLKAKPIPRNSILFAKIGEAIKQNFRVVSEREMLIDNNAMAFVPDEDSIDPAYAFHFFQQLDLYALTSKTSVPSLKKSDLVKIKIPLPPLPEQRRIAAILDKADELRQKRRQAIEKLDQLLQSVFLDMFGDPVTNPKGWDTVPVEDVVRDFIGGKNVQSAEEGDPFTHRILKVSAVTKKIYDPAESKPLPVDTAIDQRAYVTAGDLLISRANTAELVGATAYVWDTPENIVLPDKVWKFDFRNSENYPLFIWEVFKNEAFRRELSKLGSGTSGSMKNISKQKLKTVDLIQPPEKLQAHFADVSKKLHSMINRANVGDFKQEYLFQSLQQRAFNGTL